MMTSENVVALNDVALEAWTSMIREQFPILKNRVHDKNLVYLDNAATTQKPESGTGCHGPLLSAPEFEYHRGVHFLSERATEAYEGVREKTRSFLNAASTKEIVLLVVPRNPSILWRQFRTRVCEIRDEVLITAMEHHSNIVPWQLLCERTGASLMVAPIDDRGEIIVEEYERLLNGRTRIVGLAHVSNALGTVNPVKHLISLAHRHRIPVLVDGAQAAPHLRINVRDLDCEFYALSAHKMYGPTGFGVLYGKQKCLEAMPPYQGEAT